MDPIEELRYLVLAAQREGSRALTDALRPLGVTPSQAEVLAVLRSADGPLSVRQLGERLVCETGSPSRLARSIVSAGLAESSNDGADGRVTRLSLTARGVEVADQVARVEATFTSRLGESLPDAAFVAQMIEQLRAVVADRPAGRALALRREEATAVPS